MYVIFNQDGSIKETQLSRYVNQHSKGVDFVDVAIDGRTNEDYTCDANFALPNDTNVTEVAQVRYNIVTSSGTYSGYRIEFNEAETEYEGDLTCSIRVYNKDGSVLWTFPFSIVVNKTTGYGDENITNDQYESIMRALSNYQLMFAKSNMRSYDTKEEALKDLPNLANGQLIMAKEDASSQTTAVYIKNGNALEMVSLDALSLDKYLKKEVIDGTWDFGSETFTLSKKPTSVPFIAKLSGNLTTVTILFTTNAMNEYVGFYSQSDISYVFNYDCNFGGRVRVHPLTIEPTANDQVLKSKASGSTEWSSLKTINSQSLLGTGNINLQKKTFLHILTAKGATLSTSFTYPSTNELAVDSPQDATMVIKPTADEYFPSPVVVIATKKISDSYNCIHYNGTLWKFAMWDGSTFTDGEAVTTWADSVVNVD